MDNAENHNATQKAEKIHKIMKNQSKSKILIEIQTESRAEKRSCTDGAGTDVQDGQDLW